ncbi:hypothetical protein D3C80_1584390 [compost metagenome]
MQSRATPAFLHPGDGGQDVLDAVGQNQAAAQGLRPVGEGYREAAVDARCFDRLGHAEGGGGIGRDLGAGGGSDL